MSPIDLAPPAIIAPVQKLWTPAAPYIVRAREGDLDAVKAMPFMAAIAGGARRSSLGITLTYIAQLGSTTDASTYNFGTVSIPRDGLVIVPAAGRSGGSSITISSISIGGTGGSLTTGVGSSVQTGRIGYRAVAAGNHNITVTFSGGVLRCGAAVWLLENYRSATPVGQNASNSQPSNVTSQTVTFDIPANGVAVYFSYTGTAATGWSSATQVDANEYEGHFTSAYKTTASAITSHAETVSFSSALALMVGASWN